MFTNKSVLKELVRFHTSSGLTQPLPHTQSECHCAYCVYQLQSEIANLAKNAEFH